MDSVLIYILAYIVSSIVLFVLMLYSDNINSTDRPLIYVIAMMNAAFNPILVSLYMMVNNQGSFIGCIALMVVMLLSVIHIVLIDKYRQSFYFLSMFLSISMVLLASYGWLRLLGE